MTGLNNWIDMKVILPLFVVETTNYKLTNLSFCWNAAHFLEQNSFWSSKWKSSRNVLAACLCETQESKQVERAVGWLLFNIFLKLAVFFEFSSILSAFYTTFHNNCSYLDPKVEEGQRNECETLQLVL